jgi:hypothetical protein
MFYTCCTFFKAVNKLAERESLSWHPLIEDFIAIGRRLEELGFIYHKGRTIVSNGLRAMTVTMSYNRKVPR